MKYFFYNKKILTSLLTIIVIAFILHFFSNQTQAGDIYKAKKSISKTADQIKKIQVQLNAKQNQYGVNQGQIVMTKIVISKTKREINDKETKIKKLNQRIDLNKKILKNYIQEMSFESYNNPVVSFMMVGNFLNTFSGNLDQIINVKEKILNIMNQVKKDKNDLVNAKVQLVQKKEEKQKILIAKQNEQAQIVSSIKRTKATLSQLNAKLNTLRSRLASLLGEGVSMADIKNAAKIASKVTGVRKDFILGELVVESNLGRFTGGCYYDKGSHPVKKHMKSYDKTDYLKIIDDLGYGKNDKKLSCWPGYGYGGAMGIAQFMPSTWMGYKNKISSATGNKPSNPWNVVDGIMGMTIKLARAGASSKSGEYIASKRYYCGGPSSPYWHSKCDDYADNVQYWADNYESKMN